MAQDAANRSELTLAVFVDFENLALGAEHLKGGRFDIELVLKRLLEKGRIVAKRAYCDWTRYRQFMQEFHQLGFEMIDIPQTKMSGKNSADIRMVVDALDLCYSKSHIDAFALLTGDSDFSPLVSKLKENDKRVIGCGIRNSTSNLLAGSCDEFIFYDDLVKVVQRSKSRTKKSRGGEQSEQQEALDRVAQTVDSLVTEYDPLWGSLVKQAVRRIYPGFNETAYGYRSFSELLEDAAKHGLVELEFDKERGNYKVRARE
ncbi:MAG: NYN domain-containing protein [Gammaproteobacteria bacterium]|nr:NYN domain-containing protein [Gammaproteobacteria bacterium]